MTNIVDGLPVPVDVAKHFAAKYEELYTSVQYNTNETDIIRDGIYERLQTVGYDCKYVVNVYDIRKIRRAISRLNSGKNDGGVCFNNRSL